MMSTACSLSMHAISLISKKVRGCDALYMHVVQPIVWLISKDCMYIFSVSNRILFPSSEKYCCII